LYDAAGKLLQQFPNVKSGDALNLSKFASGMYLLRAAAAETIVLQQVLRL